MSSRNRLPLAGRAQPLSAPRRRRRTAGRVALATVSAASLALTVLAGSASLAMNSLTAKVTTVDVADSPAKSANWGDLTNGAVNILMMGSDKRTGKGNTGYGYFDGERSDTAMLLHVYPDRSSAVVVSIPRDTVTQLAVCKDQDGNDVAGGWERFNAAYYHGGPACSIKTLEKMSGLEIDHFVVLDFYGFKKTIDALGGVEVCLVEPIDDDTSDIHLPAGRTRISGDTALDFVRVRKGVGDGSDIGRIGRQQQFLSSLLREVDESSLLTDPLRLWRVLDESAKSLKTDQDLADPKAILALAQSMTGVRPKNVTFVTLPWLPDGTNPTVVEDTAASAPMWAALRDGDPWPPPPAVGVDGERLSVKPRDITVSVSNATGESGQGEAVAEKLRKRGYQTGSIGIAERVSQRTVIRYSEDNFEAARTLQAAVAGAEMELDDSLGDNLQLLVGTNYRGVRELNVRPEKTKRDNTPTDGTRDDGVAVADEDICA